MTHKSQLPTCFVFFLLFTTAKGKLNSLLKTVFISILQCLFFPFLKECVYLYDRKREPAGGGVEGDGEADFQLSPDVGLDPGTRRSWPELKAEPSLTEPPRLPCSKCFKGMNSFNTSPKRRHCYSLYFRVRNGGRQRFNALPRVLQLVVCKWY